MIVSKIFLDVIMAFLGTISFSILFNVPRKEIKYCGMVGAIGWLIYDLIINYINPEFIVFSTFTASLVITFASQILAFRRKMPLTVFLIPGIIPLVPGSGIYYTMLKFMNNENFEGLAQAILTLKLGGVIAIGMICVLSLPKKYL